MDPNNYNDIVYSLYKLGNAGVNYQDVRYRQLLTALNTIRSRRGENVAEFTSLTGTGQNPFNSIQFLALLNQIDAYVNYLTKSLKIPKALLYKYYEAELMEISDVFHRKNEFWGPGYFWLDYRDNLEQNKLSFFLGAITNVKTMTQYIIQNNNAILTGNTTADKEHNEHILRKFEQLFKDIGLYGYLLTFSTDENSRRGDEGGAKTAESSTQNQTEDNTEDDKQREGRMDVDGREARKGMRYTKVINTDGRGSGNDGDDETNYEDAESGERTPSMESTVSDSKQAKVEGSPTLKASASAPLSQSQSQLASGGTGTGVGGNAISPKNSKLVIKNYEQSEAVENRANAQKRPRQINGNIGSGIASVSGSGSRTQQVSQRGSPGERHLGGREGMRMNMTIRKYDFEKLLMDILKLEKKINLLLLQKNVKSILNLTRLTNKMYANNIYSNENTRVEYKRNLMEHIKNSNQAHKERYRLKRKFMQLANKYVYNKTFCNMADKEKANDNIRMTIQKDKKKIYLNVIATLEESKKQDARNEETSKIEENVYANMPPSIAGKLRNYQLQGLTWLVSLYNNKLNGILADEMGLGKTIQTIALIIYLKENKGISGPHIVLAPMSTLHSNWKNEFETWFPTCKPLTHCYANGTNNTLPLVLVSYLQITMIVIQVSYRDSENSNKYECREWRKSLRQKWYEGNKLTFDVLLTTDSFILKDRVFLKKVCWEYLIVDEAHRLKNPNSKLVKVLNQYFISNRRLLLTGTPLQNDLNELWSLLNFIKPQIFNDNNYYYQLFSLSLSSLVRRYDDCVLFTEEEQLEIINRIHKVLKPYLLRREKLEVLEEVPRNDEFIVCCPMSGVQTRLYEFLVLKDTPQNRFLQLRKICNHPYLYANNAYPCKRDDIYSVDDCQRDDMLIASSGKLCMLDLILSRLYEVSHRVLIFSQMTSMLDILEIYLSYRNYKFLRLDGSTTSEKRLERLNLFNKPNSEYFVFILSTKAGSLGINLQTADTVIIYDSDWNPQNDLQAQSRVHRIGQKNKVISLRFITPNTIEENILKSTGIKLNQNQLIIKSGSYQELGETSDDDEQLKSVFNLRNEYTEEYGIRCVELLNKILTRSEADAEAFKYVGYKNFIINPFPLIKHRVVPPFLLKTISANKRFQLTGKKRRMNGDKMKMSLDKNTWDNLCDDYNIYAAKPTEQCKMNYITNIENSKVSVEDKNKLKLDVFKHIITNLSIDYPVEYLAKLNEELNADVFKWILIENEKEKEREKEQYELKGKIKENENREENNRRIIINKAIREEVTKIMNSKTYHEFNDVPNRSQIKDYYDKISNPISLREILTMSKENKFNSILEFKGKMQLLTSNARTYNGSESAIFHKSLNLTHIIASKVSYRVMVNLIRVNDEGKAAIIDKLLSKYFI
ncbi:uncharacterized protein TOT_030000756 [Theileria orientalis strain Shintoku]|uniref:Uncharacterized protein n=1 Tax=Theileria orientalis strain Shintoku TaxID=869250 RepID=J4DPY1_THEOR|nr:uncharacterized protein TOT_030000756 [Theileria orientalis strain Shintoku]BAM41494.1 uncharacterized protein TOT_030000756 [Theileria orientalis strain Shintoku]|eukprot:XP_009691795.1 uncharacterized protein TOT_030000756 [Theileria orientalis strain Shintoku]